MLPMVIGHATWLIFVIAWNVSDRGTPTAATPGAQRERLYKLAIAFGLVMIVLSAVRLGARARRLSADDRRPWLRARLEEEFLSAELAAAAYGDYKARTPMLVPFWN